MGFVPPRIVRPREKTIEEDIEQLEQSIEACKDAYQTFNKSTRTIPGEQALIWNQALRENMLKPYSPPEPEYEEMLFAPADWQKQEVTGHD